MPQVTVKRLGSMGNVESELAEKLIAIRMAQGAYRWP